MGWLRVQNIVVIIKGKTKIKETVKCRNTLFLKPCKACKTYNFLFNFKISTITEYVLLSRA